jgi:hypothetical protein
LVFWDDFFELRFDADGILAKDQLKEFSDLLVEAVEVAPAIL